MTGAPSAVGRPRLGPVRSAVPPLWWLRPGAVTAAAVGAALVLATVDPHQAGHYPTCPFLALTGAYCPGCGSLRAVHDLLHADVAGAVARNPLAVLTVPVLLWFWVRMWRDAAGRPTPSPTRLPVWSLWGLLALVIGYAVLRNLPGWTALSPT